MTEVGEQVFTGSAHQLRFLFAPAAGHPDRLCVVFADAAQEPSLQFVRELAPLGLPKLFVLDDFGPYAGDAGYPGCWYLGEGRRFTVAEDVAALVAHARSVLTLDPSAIVAAGYGAGGFAALHLAIRNGWGRVIAGSPQTRLGAHLTGDLDEVAAFIAGGTGGGDRNWLDGILFEAVAQAQELPQIELIADGRSYGLHALPLIDALAARGSEVSAEMLPGAETPGVAAQLFAHHLLDRLADDAVAPPTRIAFSKDPSRHISRWSRTSLVRVQRLDDGLRCFAPAVGNHEKGIYAGLRFAAGPLEAVRLDMSIRRPQELETLFVDAVDASEERVARWQWSFRQRMPGSGRLTLLLTAASDPPISATISGDLTSAAALDVFVKVRNARSADFTVHSVELFAPSASQPAAELLPSNGGTTNHRSRVLRDVAGATRRVAEMAAAGVFPPPATLPAFPPRRPGLKVACLLDRFSELGFRYEFDYVDFTPDDYRAVIDREAPDMLLVESIWRGKDETWNKLMVPDTEGGGPTEPVRDLVAHCRGKGIPTVFWNKEDPPNFEHFVRTAALFDYIFTTDESCVPRYKAVVGHDRVGVLPFAAQPAIHNPAGAPAPRPLDVAFLGTFYGRKHAARKRQMEMILDPAREFGVHIYSRVEASGGYAFPGKYQPHLIGTVPYEQVLGAYRNYKVLLNVNSVPNSRTMCARRVFEILACGGMVLSGPSPALEATLGTGIVFESDSYRHTKEVLAHLLDNDALRDRIAVEAARRIYSAHTYGHRVETILTAVGLASDTAHEQIAVVAPAHDATELERAVENVLAQTRRPEWLVLVGDAEPSVPRAAELAQGGTEVILVSEGPRDGAALLACALRECKQAGRFAPFLPDAVYGPHFLEDLEYAHAFTGAEIVGKGAHYRMDPGRDWTTIERRDEENTMVAWVEPGSLVAAKTALTRVRPQRSETLIAWQRRCSERGIHVYAADRFNFVTRAASDPGMPWVAGSIVEGFGVGARHALV